MTNSIGWRFQHLIEHAMYYGLYIIWELLCWYEKVDIRSDKGNRKNPFLLCMIEKLVGVTWGVVSDTDTVEW